MRTLDDCLHELLAEGRISPADAWRNAVNKTRFAEGAPQTPAEA